MNKDYDVIITGARAAGASLAVLLGKMGKRVLLIDKAQFPSDTLSTHHLSHVEYLKELGVLQAVESSGLRKITRMRTYIGKSFVEGPRSAYTIIPRRKWLDEILVNKAQSYSSVTFLEETNVQELIWEDDAVTGVVFVNKQGHFNKATAEIVVGADGKYSAIARWVKAGSYADTAPLRPVFYGYYKGVEPLPEPTTEIFLEAGRIAFIFPMEPGVDCLGMEIQPEEYKKFAASPKEIFENTYKQLYGMKSRLKGARLEHKIIGTRGVPNFFKEPAGKGWVLIGDAAHCKDPSTGLGLNDAFMQSFLLAESIQSLDRGRTWDKVMNEFKERRDARLLPGFRLTLDYIQSLRPWDKNEEALFQAMAANPMVWNKLIPKLPESLQSTTPEIPELYGSVEMEAEELKEDKDSFRRNRS
ncbi:FAD-dependent monooxygenase [Halobacillus salinarum]|uniref:FAD-dependent monooxygenase n=1 Tax=Halobacillus salinarum TaxID=2932257 RepID=A0ABY4EL69_9BACI|nr:NAD(P)/FAD-dependent oxidoreductase [Halobacillus salinarum]UOQ45217.1 FAD-dependent monooxygenase [Halobacillus salinarum]